MHERANPEDLKKELSKYDYGISLEFLNEKGIDPLLAKTSIANKTFDYLEAGIPAILGIPCDFSERVIKKNKIGICVKYKDLENLRKILEKQDYKKMQRDIKKAQNKNRLSKKIKDFEKFYELVVRKYKKS
jgi:hypothetical protein